MSRICVSHTGLITAIALFALAGLGDRAGHGVALLADLGLDDRAIRHLLLVFVDRFILDAIGRHLLLIVDGLEDQTVVLGRGRGTIMAGINRAMPLVIRISLRSFGSRKTSKFSWLLLKFSTHESSFCKPDNAPLSLPDEIEFGKQNPCQRLAKPSKSIACGMTCGGKNILKLGPNSSEATVPGPSRKRC